MVIDLKGPHRTSVTESVKVQRPAGDSDRPGSHRGERAVALSAVYAKAAAREWTVRAADPVLAAGADLVEAASWANEIDPKKYVPTNVQRPLIRDLPRGLKIKTGQPVGGTGGENDKR